MRTKIIEEVTFKEWLSSLQDCPPYYFDIRTESGYYVHLRVDITKDRTPEKLFFKQRDVIATCYNSYELVIKDCCRASDFEDIKTIVQDYENSFTRDVILLVPEKLKHELGV